MFAALALPDDVTDALRARVEQARQVDPSLRWVPGSEWHVTLAFYSDVADALVPDLVERLRRAAARTRPFTVAVGPPACFGSTRRARVVWLGLSEGGSQSGRLAASARAAGRRIGLAGDDLAADARYRPHVTLARVSPARDVSGVLGALGGRPDVSWTATDAVLVRSDPPTVCGGRPAHTVHARLAFRPDRAQPS